MNIWEKISAEEYVTTIVNRHKKTNKSREEQVRHLGFEKNWLVSRANCELCGGPHAVLAEGSKVVLAVFWFSGDVQPDELDKRFIGDFKSRFFAC